MMFLNPLTSLLDTLRLSLRTHLLAVGLALSLCLASNASALTIDVSGVAGSGTTSWQFSGTSNTGFLGEAQEADGYHGFTAGNGGWTNLNSWAALAGSFGTNLGIALGSGATITGSSSGAHVIEGVFLLAGSFRWHADGAFPRDETLTYSGNTTAAFDITQIAGISGIGDFTTVTSSTGIGDLTVNFTAVPEPSTALLLLLGLGQIADRAFKLRFRSRTGYGRYDKP
ncbi:MAG: PEP-CTERM sorting domain-containing protein [Deltaproteobacteria bacterium]|nr:PEP-CTERM sorting domain-containing protein [Deltaproteobacteria bacterium]